MLLGESRVWCLQILNGEVSIGALPGMGEVLHMSTFFLGFVGPWFLTVV